MIRGRVGALALVALLGASCVSNLRNEVEEAQARLDACQAEHEACESERAALQNAQERYEETSRRAWGCNTGAPDCPVER